MEPDKYKECMTYILRKFVNNKSSMMYGANGAKIKLFDLIEVDFRPIFITSSFISTLRYMSREYY